MNIALWIVAAVLAVMFVASGAMKVVRRREQLVAAGLGFAEDFGSGSVKAIGVVEILAGVGLVLPAAVGIAPVLVPLAAVGVGLLMVGAAGIHLRRHESQAIVMNAVLLALAVLVAWGRFGPQSF